MIVLLFALANGIYEIGILSALAMGIGVAITVSAVGVGSILIRRGLLSAASLSGGGTFAALPKLLSILGSLAVCLIGIALFAGAAQSMG